MIFLLCYYGQSQLNTIYYFHTFNIQKVIIGARTHEAQIIVCAV